MFDKMIVKFALDPIICPRCFKRIPVGKLHFRTGRGETAIDPYIQRYREENGYERGNERDFSFYAPENFGELAYKDDYTNDRPMWEKSTEEIKWSSIKRNRRRYKKGDLEINTNEKQIVFHGNDGVNSNCETAVLGLCPHCHQTLSQNFGFVKTLKATLGGLTANGKTAFLCAVTRVCKNAPTVSVLVNGEKYRIRFSVALTEGDNATFSKAITDPTDVHENMKQLTITAVVNDTDKYKIIVADIAGEVQYNQNDAQGAAIATERISNRARQCDGVIFMIEPFYLDLVKGYMRDVGLNVAQSDNINDVCKRFEQYANSLRRGVPIAVTLSKSDRIYSAITSLNAEHNVRQTLNTLPAVIVNKYLMPATITSDIEASQYFSEMDKSTKNIAMVCSADPDQDLYNDVISTVDRRTRRRLNDGWFMLSALGGEVTKESDALEREPWHVLDPIIWILLQNLFKNGKRVK